MQLNFVLRFVMVCYEPDDDDIAQEAQLFAICILCFAFLCPIQWFLELKNRIKSFLSSEYHLSWGAMVLKFNDFI